MQKVQIEESWYNVLKDEFEKEYFQKISSFLHNEKRSGKVIYPPGGLIFNAFNLTPFEKVKVVILGQDPYHNPGQAHGLSFSVPDGIPAPPSLINIYKEIESDLYGNGNNCCNNSGIPRTRSGSGNLTSWAQQGVFLLNAMLTVEAGRAASHSNIGWQNFTDAVIRSLSEHREHLVFMLWGNFAKSKAELIDQSRHLVLTAAHPSPLARGAFFGCRHFSQCNNYLHRFGMEPINWQI